MLPLRQIQAGADGLIGAEELIGVESLVNDKYRLKKQSISLQRPNYGMVNYGIISI